MTQNTKSQSPPLPSYKKPPVTEVVLGVQFEPIAEFNALHPGRYGQRVQDDFPLFEEKPPLASWANDPTQEFVFSSKPPLPRCWYKAENENQIIQLQSDKFIQNWRQITGEETYPRYDKIRQDFSKRWSDFIVFAKEQSFSDIKVNRWEVTYVNHLEKNKDWDSLSDLKNLIACWSGNSSDGFLPQCEHLDLTAHYAFPDNNGRLLISLVPAKLQSDDSEILLLKLTAQGDVVGSENKSVLEGLDLGREWIVRGFTDFTTKEAHEIWEREI